jgi:hypothetical protein
MDPKHGPELHDHQHKHHDHYGGKKPPRAKCPGTKFYSGPRPQHASGWLLIDAFFFFLFFFFCSRFLLFQLCFVHTRQHGTQCKKTHIHFFVLDHKTHTQMTLTMI